MHNILLTRVYFLVNKNPPCRPEDNVGDVNIHSHIVARVLKKLNQRGREYYGIQYFSGLVRDQSSLANLGDVSYGRLPAFVMHVIFLSFAPTLERG